MAFTEEEQRQLDQLLGSQQAQTQQQAPGSIPPSIPVGRPYPTSVRGGKVSYAFPPPPAEIQRQLEVDKLKQSQKPPKPLTAKQQDAIDGLQGTAATLKELVQFMNKYPETETGLTKLSYRRDIIGDVSRTFDKPEVTQMAQISNRMQDAYRRYVTGVQAGFQEVASFLPSSIPNPSTLPKDKYLAAIDTFSREVERSKIPLQRAMKLRGYSQEQIDEMFAPLPTLAEMQSAVTSSENDPYVAEAKRRGLIK